MTVIGMCGIFTAVIICIIVVKSLADYRYKQMVFNYISWIEYGITEMTRWVSPYDCVRDVQKELEIPKQYSLSDKDEENIKIILTKFQQDISKKYFSGKLSLGKPNRKIRAKDMFFYLLFTYLQKHVCDYSFEGHTMYRQICKKSYGYWGGELYDSENELTDFGISYGKLRYIASEYSYRHEEIRKVFEISKCDYITKEIDEKRISISRM